MKITRDVITDLLPVYLAGEASPDTECTRRGISRRASRFRKTGRRARATAHAQFN